VVAALFEDVLAVERVGVHDDFFELGGDSLSAVELLAGLAEELDLALSASDLLRHATVEAVAARLDDDRDARSSVVVRVNDARGPSVFCVPGAADTPLQYRQLGRRLDDVSVWAFSYRGIDQRAIPDQTVGAVARRNVRALREVDPHGPYRLLGYSFGGTVALEMARQLRAAGGDVELVVLLEHSIAPGLARTTNDSDVTRAPSTGAPASSWASSWSSSFVARVHRNALDAHPENGTAARLGRVGYVIRSGVRFALRPFYVASAGIVARDGLAQHEVFLYFHGRLSRAHRRRPYDGRTVVVAAPAYLQGMRDVLDHLLPPESAGGCRRDVVVAGEHLDLLREPNVAEVARTLDLLLAPVRA
jgi:thioesterase domain-containing protein/acyl carrier protein